MIIKKSKIVLSAVLAAVIAASCTRVTASARTLVLLGDYDADGIVTSNDALEVLRCSADNPDNLSTTVFSRSDVDKDNDITSNDAVLILRDSVGLEELPNPGGSESAYSVSDGISDFSAGLFKRTYKQGENTLVSPLSVYTALSMLNNGAKGLTGEEMLSVLGSDNALSTAEINSYLHDYMTNVNAGDTMKISNSMFVMQRPDVVIDEGFSETIRRDYFAEIFNEPANDDTVNMINLWCKDKTDGMIDEILKPGMLTPDVVNLLLNAVSFDAEWSRPYEKWNVSNHTFTNYNGSTISTPFLFGEENSYLSDENCVGFTKHYKSKAHDENNEWIVDEDYCFLAILPNEDVGVDGYIEQMNDSTLSQLIHSRNYSHIKTAIPKFSYECEYLLNNPLCDMGMPTAFTDGADLTGMARSENGSVFVDKVMHKTFIQLNEAGTKAAAVTAIMDVDSAEPITVTQVYLDRPFIYAIYDLKNDVPVFIGTVCDMSSVEIPEAEITSEYY